MKSAQQAAGEEASWQDDPWHPEAKALEVEAESAASHETEVDTNKMSRSISLLQEKLKAKVSQAQAKRQSDEDQKVKELESMLEQHEVAKAEAEEAEGEEADQSETAPVEELPPPPEPPASTVPPYNAGAKGTPNDWNNNVTQYFWSKKTKKWFNRYAPKPDFKNMHDFFAQRLGPDGTPISELLGSPEEHAGGWLRCAWQPFKEEELPVESSGEWARDGKADWDKSFHGCKVEALYSIMYHRKIMPSADESRGDRFHESCPGVYVFSEARRSKAMGYSRFVQLFGDGTFWACMWEVRVDRACRFALSKVSDQWVQPEPSVHLEALWLCARGYDEMDVSWPVQEAWDPLLEANPKDAVWTQAGATVPVDDRLKEGGSDHVGDPESKRARLDPDAGATASAAGGGGDDAPVDSAPSPKRARVENDGSSDAISAGTAVAADTAGAPDIAAEQ